MASPPCPPLCVCVCVAAAAVPAPVFDEDSVASVSALQDETRDGGGGGVAENGGAANLPPFQGGYMLAASYWPKVRRPAWRPLL